MIKQQDKTMKNTDQFVGIMQAFGQSFLQPDLDVFKQNLQILEALNSKWKLYHKVSENLFHYRYN